MDMKKSVYLISCESKGPEINASAFNDCEVRSIRSRKEAKEQISIQSYLNVKSVQDDLQVIEIHKTGPLNIFKRF